MILDPSTPLRFGNFYMLPLNLNIIYSELDTLEEADVAALMYIIISLFANH